MRPVTDEQWQDAVDAAHTILTLEIGRLYGLVRVIPEFDIEECHRILAEGRERGILPASEVADLVAAAESLLEKCRDRLGVLQNKSWIGTELGQLRRAMVRVKKGRTYTHAHS